MKIFNYRLEEKDIDVITVGIVGDTSGCVYAFHCSKCGQIVFQYQGRVVTEFPGGSPVEIPIIAQCSNRPCGQKYLISVMVSR